MPGRSSGGSRSSGKSARPAPCAPSRNVPKRATKSTPPAPVQGNNGSILGSIGSTIAEGMAFGTGSAIAHRVTDTIFGPRVIQHETVASPAPAIAAAVPVQSSNLGASDACSNQSKAFQDCINSYGSDISKCQFYMDMLQECRRGSGSGAVLGV